MSGYIIIITVTFSSTESPLVSNQEKSVHHVVMERLGLKTGTESSGKKSGLRLRCPPWIPFFEAFYQSPNHCWVFMKSLCSCWLEAVLPP